MNFKPFDPYQDGTYSAASVTLTIGCNVDDEPAFEPSEVWEAFKKHVTYHAHSYTVEQGEWEGVPEKSVHIIVGPVVDWELQGLLSEVERLADALEQDAIGVWDIYGGSRLVYGRKWHAKQARRTA